MPAFKDIDQVKGRKALAAWERWFDTHIRIAHPKEEDLRAMPTDTYATAMLGKLPPGWGWVDDEAQEQLPGLK